MERLWCLWSTEGQVPKTSPTHLPCETLQKPQTSACTSSAPTPFWATSSPRLREILPSHAGITIVSKTSVWVDAAFVTDMHRCVVGVVTLTTQADSSVSANTTPVVTHVTAAARALTRNHGVLQLLIAPMSVNPASASPMPLTVIMTQRWKRREQV